MTVQELVARFAEIPKDLHEEPILSRFAEVLGELLREARNPSACATQHDASNHYYLKLIGPVAIYDYGLSTRKRVLAELQERLDRHETDPGGFTANLLPKDTAEREVRGPGCS